MTETLQYGGLTVAKELDDFLREEVVKGIDVDADKFWSCLELILEDFGPRNKLLLNKREELQKQIDEWHISKKDKGHDHESYVEFLKEINSSFGCFDFMKGIDGNYYFLECNPNGQWLWIEEDIGLSISKEIADYLNG